MRAREIMDCFFTVCSEGDTVSLAAQMLIEREKSFVVVAAEDNTYKGIVTAQTLLKYINYPKKKIGTIIEKVHAIFETEELSNFNKVDSDIIPVIDSKENVVGVINLKSYIEYSPQYALKNANLYLGNSKNSHKYNPKYTIDNIIGESKEILQLKEQIIAAARTKSTVLIMGETGTGKELVAHAITNLSSRRHQPFVRVNCAAIPDNLLESELFGYEQGAFTGAVKGGSPGKFIIADNGTIFLDEIGDMEISLQAKILRVIQEREVEKVGGHFPIPIDVRIISATHANLPELVKENKFRRDLFYRLHVIPINVPPLRTHKEDIPLLTDYFINKISSELNISKPAVDSSFINKLLDYDWPGNIRELLNAVEMAVNFSEGIIAGEHIPDYIFNKDDFNYIKNEKIDDLKEFTDDVERDTIIKALRNHKGNKIKVAEALGISRSNLYYKMRKLEIESKQIKADAL